MKRSLLLIMIFVLGVSLIFSQAHAAPAPALLGSFTLTPDAASKSDAPGQLITFNFSITNTSDSTKTYSGSYSGDWSATTPIGPYTLAGGANTAFAVHATVPENAGNGDNGFTTVTINDGVGGESSIRLETVAVVSNNANTRPLVTIQGYGANVGTVTGGQEFDLQVVLRNTGNAHAGNVVISFTSSDFYMQDTGGVIAVGAIVAQNNKEISQPMKAVSDIGGKEAGSVTVSISYSSPNSTAYTGTFNLSIPLRAPVYTVPKPTATGTVLPRPQVVVKGYRASVDPLQPGTTFNLELEITNLGNSDARAVTMVLGGGTGVDNSSGTPVPGGVGGGSSDLTNFAPLGTSNLYYLGDLAAGVNVQRVQTLIVNVTTAPGAYPLKLSFIYTDTKGNRLQDDQTITLLVLALPQVDISFYSDPGIFFTGQTSLLPLQVTNLGRKSAVLGNLKVTAANGEVTNGVSLVGALEPGGYFTLDANLTPFQSGALDVEVIINYTDDFNQPRTIEHILTVDVQEAMVEPFPPDENGVGIPMPVVETFWDKVLRFFKGLLGLDGAPPQPQIQPVIPLDGGGGGWGGDIPVKPAG